MTNKCPACGAPVDGDVCDVQCAEVMEARVRRAAVPGRRYAYMGEPKLVAVGTEDGRLLVLRSDQVIDFLPEVWEPVQES